MQEETYNHCRKNEVNNTQKHQEENNMEDIVWQELH